MYSTLDYPCSRPIARATVGSLGGWRVSTLRQVGRRAGKPCVSGTRGFAVMTAGFGKFEDPRGLLELAGVWSVQCGRERQWQTDRQTESERDWQTDRVRDRQTNRQTESEWVSERETETENRAIGTSVRARNEQSGFCMNPTFKKQSFLGHRLQLKNNILFRGIKE